MRNYIILYTLTFLFFITTGCEQEKIIPKKGYIPNVPQKTETLQAAYFWIPQDKLSSSYWKEANYVEVKLDDISTQKLYPQAYLNMTGTYYGKNSFNNGNSAIMTLKAGYDESHIYILAEWDDNSVDASFMSWLWNGPSDPLKQEGSDGWTFQRNSDMIFLAFDSDDNKKDVWKWNIAHSAPFTAALNMTLKADGQLVMDGPPAYKENNDGTLNNPLYEWDGERQELETDNGTTILDPAYYILDENRMEFKGNVSLGAIAFNETADCKFCHGIDGDGITDGSTDGGKLQNTSLNKYTREGLVDYIGSTAHEGRGSQYFGKIKDDSETVENLIAFIRGICGVPGTYINSEEFNVDIKALSNISVGGIKKENERYQVLFIRNLKTESNNDISFDPSKTYTFSIGVSDNDDINNIGIKNLQLQFKSSEL
ncbi:hypothetical protein E9993_08375 [Labilibacter sediminis]|nr:hypothetical protein E9993_08375 [Labilibacter sediminis]